MISPCILNSQHSMLLTTFKKIFTTASNGDLQCQTSGEYDVCIALQVHPLCAEGSPEDNISEVSTFNCFSWLGHMWLAWCCEVFLLYNKPLVIVVTSTEPQLSALNTFQILAPRKTYFSLKRKRIWSLWLLCIVYVFCFAPRDRKGLYQRTSPQTAASPERGVTSTTEGWQVYMF
jgi:hypothetical protein